MGLFGEILKTVVTAGISNVVGAKKERQEGARNELLRTIDMIRFAYENKLSPSPKVQAEVDGYLNEFKPSVFKELLDSSGDVSYPLYRWALQQKAVVFDGMDEELANRQFAPIVYSRLDFLSGKFDFATLAKQALLAVSALAASVLSGGLGAPAALAGFYIKANALEKIKMEKIQGATLGNVIKANQNVTTADVEADVIKNEISAGAGDIPLFGVSILCLLIIFLFTRKPKR